MSTSKVSISAEQMHELVCAPTFDELKVGQADIRKEMRDGHLRTHELISENNEKLMLLASSSKKEFSLFPFKMTGYTARDILQVMVVLLAILVALERIIPERYLDKLKVGEKVALNTPQIFE